MRSVSRARRSQNERLGGLKAHAAIMMSRAASCLIKLGRQHLSEYMPTTEAPERPGVVALGWVSFLTDVSSDMICPAPPGLPDAHADGRARGRSGWIEGVADATASFVKMRLGLVVGPREPPQAARRRSATGSSSVVRPLVGPRAELGPGRSRSASSTASARGSARRRATR